MLVDLFVPLMLTPKQNLYLISINVTNKLKEKFYHEYVPEVIDVRLASPICISGSHTF